MILHSPNQHHVAHRGGILAESADFCPIASASLASWERPLNFFARWVYLSGIQYLIVLQNPYRIQERRGQGPLDKSDG